MMAAGRTIERRRQRAPLAETDPPHPSLKTYYWAGTSLTGPENNSLLEKKKDVIAMWANIFKRI